MVLVTALPPMECAERAPAPPWYGERFGLLSASSAAALWPAMLMLMLRLLDALQVFPRR